MTTGCLPTGRIRNSLTIVIFENVFISCKVAAFIKSERTSRYPGLTIKYVRGADPIIKVKHFFIVDAY